MPHSKEGEKHLYFRLAIIFVAFFLTFSEETEASSYTEDPPLLLLNINDVEEIIQNLSSIPLDHSIQIPDNANVPLHFNRLNEEQEIITGIDLPDVKNDLPILGFIIYWNGTPSVGQVNCEGEKPVSVAFQNFMLSRDIRSYSVYIHEYLHLLLRHCQYLQQAGSNDVTIVSKIEASTQLMTIEFLCYEIQQAEKNGDADKVYFLKSSLVLLLIQIFEMYQYVLINPEDFFITSNPDITESFMYGLLPISGLQNTIHGNTIDIPYNQGTNKFLRTSLPNTNDVLFEDIELNPIYEILAKNN